MSTASELPLAHAGSMRHTLPAEKKIVTRTILALALLTAAGAWLRLSHLGTKSLWLDEGATVALARASWSHFIWVWWHGEANPQTIYFLVMRGWILLGRSETCLRLPSALFGVASIPLMYVMARRFVSVGPALEAAALLAFSPAHVYYSQEARSYTLTILFVLLSSYFFVRAVEGDRRRDWVLWTILCILAFYSHYFSALVPVAQACSLFFRKKPPWKPTIVGGLVILVTAIPGLTYIFRAAPENLHFIWMPQASPRELWHLGMFYGGSGVKVFLALILWIAGLVAIARTRGRDSESFWRGMLIVSWAVLPAAITAAVSLRHPIFMQRYLIFSLPATMLLAAMGMAALRKMHVGVVLVVALCAMSIPTIVKDYHKPREDWRSASSAILASALPGDAVVFFPFYTRIMLDYYSGRATSQPALHVFAPQYYAGGEDERDLLQALSSNPHQFRRVWVVLYGSREERDLEERSPALAAKLQPSYPPPEVRRFADITVLEFGK